MAKKIKKINRQDVVTTALDSVYVVLNDGTKRLLQNITIANLRTLLASGIALIEEVIATETSLADFAAASAGYTFQQGDIIVITDAQSNIFVYMYIGGTKTDVGNYRQIDASKVSWANVLNKPFTISAVAPTADDDTTEGITVGWIWTDSVTGEIYTCTDVTEGAAVWVKMVKDNGVKRYKALISQTGTDAPTAIVLENSLGEVPSYSYVGAGNYLINTVGNVFTTQKTLIYYTNTQGLIIQMDRAAANEIEFFAVEPTTGANVDDIFGVSISIEVYP